MSCICSAVDHCTMHQCYETHCSKCVGSLTEVEANNAHFLNWSTCHNVQFGKEINFPAGTVLCLYPDTPERNTVIPLPKFYNFLGRERRMTHAQSWRDLLAYERKRETGTLMPAGKMGPMLCRGNARWKHLGHKRMDDLLLETCTGLKTCYFFLTATHVLSNESVVMRPEEMVKSC